MAGKKVKNEIDGIRGEMRALSEAVWALRDQVTFHNAAAAAGANPTRMAATAAASGIEVTGAETGTVASRGVVRDASTGQEYRWDYEGPVDVVLGIDDEGAARLMAAIGHRQRLAILKTLLAAPATAADLVTSLDLGTTGAAYHHLNVLQAADLVTQATRGVFSLPPYRVAALVAMFAGLQAAATTSVTDAAPGEDAAGDKTDGKGKKKKAA